MRIYLLHRHRYWTEYLDFLLDDPSHFGIVKSKDALEDEYLGHELPLFHPDQHKILLTSGLFDDQTKNNFIIFRSQHSPGFYVLPQMIGYRGFKQYHAKSDFRMYLLDSHYRALMMREFDHPDLDAIRYEMIEDSRVRQMTVDLSMYRVKEAPVIATREIGTGLVCLRWLSQYVSLSKISDILKAIRKNLKLSLVIHPCTKSVDWIKGIRELEGDLVEKVYENIPRFELINLFDAHEYIITDGSGSCYEGMIRGCKPLAIHHLYDDVDAGDMAMEMVYDYLEEEYFPFCSYQEISSYSENIAEGFIKQMYPFLYDMTKQEAMELSRKEILDCQLELQN